MNENTNNNNILRKLALPLLVILFIMAAFFISKSLKPSHAVLDDVILQSDEGVTFNIKEELSSDKNPMFAMWLKTNDGDFVEVTNTTIFPSGALLNEDLTGCIDRSGNTIEAEIEWTRETGNVFVKSKKTSFCYLYFEVDTIAPTVSSFYLGGSGNPASVSNVNTSVYITFADNDVSEYCIANSNSSTSCVWIPLTATQKTNKIIDDTYVLPTADGSYTRYAFIRDIYGNVSPSKNDSITLSKTKPGVSITATKKTSGTSVASDNYANEGLNFVLTQTACENGTTCTIKYCKDTANTCDPKTNGTTATSGSSITSYNTITSGTYYIRYYIVSTSTAESDVAYYKAKFDTTAPVIVLDHDGSSISGTITDTNGSGVVAYNIKTASTEAGTAGEPTTWGYTFAATTSKTITSTTQSNTYARVYAKDDAGNTSYTVVELQSAATINKSGTTTVTSSMSDSNPTCVVVTSSIATCSRSGSAGNWTWTITGSKGGSTVIKIKNNAGSVVLVKTINVLEAPSVPTITANDSITSGNWHKASTTLSFSGSTVANGSGNVTYYYGTSSGTQNTNGSSVTQSTSTSGVTYYVKACNSLNTSLCSSTASYNLKVDLTPPEVAVSTTSGTTYAKSMSATVTLSDTYSGLTNTGFKIYYKWSTSSVACSAMTDYITITPTAGATSKTGTITISAGTGAGKLYICNKGNAITDLASNSLAAASGTANANMYLDNTGPVIVLTHTGTTFAGTITDANSGTTAYSITDSNEVPSSWGTTFTATTSAKSIPSTANTSDWKYVHAKDALGNTSYTRVNVKNYTVSVGGAYSLTSTWHSTMSCTSTNTSVATCSASKEDNTWTFTITGVATGTALVKVLDSNGSVYLARNVTVGYATPTCTTGNAPTITASDGKASGSWHTADTTLTFSGCSIENGSGTVKYYRYNSSNANLIQGNSVTRSADTSGLTIYVKACNSLDTENCSGESSYLVKMDQTPPALSVSVPSGTTYAKSKTATVTLSDSTSGLGSSSYTVYYKWSTSSVACSAMTDTVTLTRQSGNKTATGTVTKDSGSGAGSIYVCNKSAISDVAGTSLAANAGLTSKEMYVDNTRPAVVLTYNESNNKIGGTITDAHSGVTNYVHSTSSDTPTSWGTAFTATSSKTITAKTAESGWNYFHAKDAAGNTSSSTLSRVQVINSTVYLGEGDTTLTSTITTTMSCSSTNTSVATCTASESDGTWTFVLHPVAAGTATIKIARADGGLYYVRNWTVTARAPSKPTITASDGGASGSWHTADTTLTASGSTLPSGSSGTVKYYWWSSNTSTLTNDNELTRTVDTDGVTYYFKACNSKDTTNACSEAASYVMKKDEVAPTVILTALSATSVKATMTDATSKVKGYVTNTTSATPDTYTEITAVSPKEVTWTYTAGSGRKYVHAKDAAGNHRSASITIAVRSIKKSASTTIELTTSSSLTTTSDDSSIATCVLSGSSGAWVITITGKALGTTFCRTKLSNGSEYHVTNVNVIQAPTQPTITASDSITSGNWHTANYTLTFSGSTLSGPGSVTYIRYNSDDSTDITGSSASISTATSGRTFYVRACNSLDTTVCSSNKTYISRLDKTDPTVSWSPSGNPITSSSSTRNVTVTCNDANSPTGGKTVSLGSGSTKVSGTCSDAAGRTKSYSRTYTRTTNTSYDYKYKKYSAGGGYCYVSSYYYSSCTQYNTSGSTPTVAQCNQLNYDYAITCSGTGLCCNSRSSSCPSGYSTYSGGDYYCRQQNIDGYEWSY